MKSECDAKAGRLKPGIECGGCVDGKLEILALNGHSFYCNETRKAADPVAELACGEAFVIPVTLHTYCSFASITNDAIRPVNPPKHPSKLPVAGAFTTVPLNNLARQTEP